MTRSEFVKNLMRINPTITHEEAEKSFSLIIDEIISALSKRNRVELRGFGVFEPRHRGAKDGRNPKTGQSVKVPQKYVPFFRAGKQLRDSLMS